MPQTYSDSFLSNDCCVTATCSEPLLSSFSEEANMNDKWKGDITVDQVDMLKRVAQSAATKLRPVEAYSISVLLSMAFGTGTIQCRIFAWHVNAVRRDLGLPQITQAAAGNPTMDEKMQILQSAVEKLDDEAQDHIPTDLSRDFKD